MTNKVSLSLRSEVFPDQIGQSLVSVPGDGATHSLESAEKDWNAPIYDQVGGCAVKACDFFDRRKMEDNRLFFKTPKPDASEDDKEDFRREFEHRDELNRAAQNLADSESQAKGDGNVAIFRLPRLILSGDLKKGEEPTSLPCLVYEHMKGSMLSAIDKFDGGFAQAANFLSFAKSLAQAVQKLHNQKIVHSFLVPRHILCADSRDDPVDQFANATRFSVVGFGYARLCDSAGRSHRDPTLPEGDTPFLAPEAKETGAGRSFWFPADIYSIGAILLYLLLRVGKWPASHPKKGNHPEKLEALKALTELDEDPRRLRRQIAALLWETNRDLIIENENILKIVDSCLRYDQEDRYSCVEELLDAIELAMRAKFVNAADTLSRAPIELMERSSKAATLEICTIREGKKSKPLQSFAKSLAATSAQRFLHEYTTLKRGHLEVYGSRNSIVHSLCELLAGAEPGWTYDTVTLPDYWLDHNLGARGRFLTMNKHMARRGLQIRRVFLLPIDPIKNVPMSYHLLPEPIQDMLDIQDRAIGHMERDKQIAGITSLKTYKPLEVRVLGVKHDQIQNFEAQGKTVAYLKKADAKAKGNAEAIFLNFFSTTRTEWSRGEPVVHRTIRKLRYWWYSQDGKEKIKLKADEFQTYFDSATPLGHYIRGFSLNDETPKSVPEFESLKL